MFVFILAGAALLIAVTAAFFSVWGIGHLFAGSAVPVMIMASALEIGKLVTVSFLYRHWHDITKTLKTYLLVAASVLMLITSVGIYGYLTSAYAKVAAVPQAIMNQMAVIDSQKVSISENIQQDRNRLTQLDQSRTTTEQSIDAVLGTSGNSQRRLQTIDKQETTLHTAITTLLSKRDSLDIAKIGLQNQLSSNEKIGTFIYVANALGMSLDQMVKWFTLVIVLVFDPLSISLVLAYNTIITKTKGKKVEEMLPSEQPSEPLNDATIRVVNSIIKANVPEESFRRDPEHDPEQRNDGVWGK